MKRRLTIVHTLPQPIVHIQTQAVQKDDRYGFYLVLSNTKDVPVFFCNSADNNPSILPAYEETDITATEMAQISVHADFAQVKWFYLKHKASGLVLSVEHGFWLDHTKVGAKIALSHQRLCGSSSRHALLDLQLWRFEDGFIINRRTGLVLDVWESIFKPGTKIIQWSRSPPEKPANQQWEVSDGLIQPKSYPNLVLDVDGDATCDGSTICLGERKETKNVDQRWSFEAATFSWLTSQTTHTYTTKNDEELLKEYESSRFAQVKENKVAPVDSWLYLKSGISDLALEDEHRCQDNEMKETMRELLCDIYSVDTQFVFGPVNNASETRVWAHRSVLTKYPVFDGLFRQALMANPQSAVGPLSVSVTKVPLTVFATLLRFLYTKEVERTNYPHQFAISKPSRSIQDAAAGTKGSHRWHPLDLDTPLRTEPVTWKELLDAATIYKVDALHARCEAELKGIAKVGAICSTMPSRFIHLSSKAV